VEPQAQVLRVADHRDAKTLVDALQDPDLVHREQGECAGGGHDDRGRDDEETKQHFEACGLAQGLDAHVAHLRQQHHRRLHAGKWLRAADGVHEDIEAEEADRSAESEQHQVQGKEREEVPDLREDVRPGRDVDATEALQVEAQRVELLWRLRVRGCPSHQGHSGREPQGLRHRLRVPGIVAQIPRNVAALPGLYGRGVGRVTPTLEAIRGRSAAQVLLYLEAYGAGYGKGITDTYEVAVSGIRRQFSGWRRVAFRSVAGSAVAACSSSSCATHGTSAPRVALRRVGRPSRGYCEALLSPTQAAQTDGQGSVGVPGPTRHALGGSSGAG